MAKNNDKRAERMARSNRNVNRAITVLMAGVIAEFYLLMVNNYYVKGGVGQVLTMMTVLQVIDYIGCALFGAGLVVWLMRKKWTRFAPAAPWLLCIGFFFAVSSILMLKVYPQGTTMMCVIVPVVMLIGIVFLLYPREFSVQAVGLTASLMAMYLIHRGSGSDTWGGIVTGCSILAICVVAVLGVAVFMLHEKSGSIVNISSIWGQHGASCEVTYSCTKHALIGLTRSLAMELAPSGIRVNCVAPGVIETDMVKVLGEETLKDLAEQTPLGRLGKPEDIAAAVAYLASDKASFVTGQVLAVDGAFVL